jgi:hypothetical protein
VRSWSFLHVCRVIVRRIDDAYHGCEGPFRLNAQAAGFIQLYYYNIAGDICTSIRTALDRQTRLNFLRQAVDFDLFVLHAA